MSTPEAEPRLLEGEAIPQSRGKLTRNSKGDPQWEVSVAEHADAAELARIRDLAISEYNEIQKALLG